VLTIRKDKVDDEKKKCWRLKDEKLTIRKDKVDDEKKKC